MKRITIIFILFYPLIISSQLKNKNLEQQEYIPNYIKIDIFRKITNKKLTKKDLKKIKIINGDTLVYVKNIEKLFGIKSNHKDGSLAYKSKSYMPLYQYKKRYSTKITKEDTLNFIFKDKDTLIEISNKDFYKNKKRVRVPYEPKDSTFLEIYKDIVYQKYSLPTEYQKNKNYMRLWVKPIKIYFAKSLDVDYKNAIIKTAKKLTKEVDSLHISFVDDLEKSNYIVYQIDDKHKYKYSKLIANNDYIEYRIFWNQNKIYDAKLEINLTKYKNLSKKTNIKNIIKNFYKTLGRFHETYKVPDTSILSKKI